MTHIPDSHPRAASLRLRERLVEGLHAGVVSETGLIAHGRGEALDYLLGEQTHRFAREALTAASALLRLATHPVMTVNGNVAALVGPELKGLVQHHPWLTLEINLFHYSRPRAARVLEYLRHVGLPRVLHHGDCEHPAVLAGLESDRRWMHPDGVGRADVVLVALEDGDRCQALVNSGRRVIAIDLNPLSRTAQAAHVSIVDELSRTLPQLDQCLQRDQQTSRHELEARWHAYDNRVILGAATTALRTGIGA